MTAEHERHKMAQAIRRFNDAARGYVGALWRELFTDLRRSADAPAAFPLDRLPVLRLAGMVLAISAILLFLKALQS